MISVIIPVYQVEAYLEKCLDSVINQTYKDLEIIIVDDGSTDSCSDICDVYAKRDKRIKVIHQKNGGLSAARNSGLDIAAGDYIGFVDSDDYIEVTMFEKLYQALVRNDADIAICDFQRVDTKGNTKSIEREISWLGAGIDFVREDGLKRNYAWNKLYRTDLFEGIRFPIGKKYEDIFIMHEVFANSRRVITIPDVEYNYCQRENSITFNKAACSSIDYCEGCVKRIEYLIGIDASFEAMYFYVNEYNNYCRLLKNVSLDKVNEHRLSDIQKNLHKMQIQLVAFAKKSPNAKLNIMYLLKVLSPSLFDNLSHLYSNINIQLDLLSRYRNCDGIAISKRILKNECKKYSYYIKNGNNYDRNDIKEQYHSFFQDEINCIHDSLSLPENIVNPVLIVVVKNELNRMRLFYNHYKEIGVNKFIVIDNGSTDGTLEFVCAQENTRVYQVLESFKTRKKEAWIQRVLAMTGYDRWYIVVDSDELLDYPNSEQHSISELIETMHDRGYRRLCGFMLDMYSKENLFSVECDSMNILTIFNYFDKDSYYLNRRDILGNISANDEIYGGPRYRLLGVNATQSKQSVFYYGKDSFYRNCHYLLPRIDWEEAPCCFVLRHYKFLMTDRDEYNRRISDNSFFNNSIEYKMMMNSINKYPDGVSFFYEDSVCYEDSNSLKCLPYLVEIKW